MLLGLITDVHEQVEALKIALRVFEREGVDRTIFLGDFVHGGTRLDETADLLLQGEVQGVWGNHDFGLCGDVCADYRQRFKPQVFEFAAQLQPRMQLEDCHFTHVEPWLNTTRVEDLWYFDGIPSTQEHTARTFEASTFPPDFDTAPARVMFFGHMHRYFAASTAHILNWNGEVRLHLRKPDRYLICLAALCDAHCAMYDTETGMLMPLDLSRVRV